MMYEHLQKWGPRKQEVKFFLRHEDSPTESSDQGSQHSQDQANKKNTANIDKHSENGDTEEPDAFLFRRSSHFHPAIPDTAKPM
ncbi:hypothetical protein JZ751_002981 [Albula glossodonta]|uniref:Apoptosis-stimulating of p53 protein 2-like RA domain-containing protein n=1 Tax=Albula glossodonta TaxID=121402 RepID=A0A8T2N9K8_9TELE|nr:hypothetical protein JZ751_002981 [Albula glossodonta]